MTLLASLVRAYERRSANLPPFGYCEAKISFEISLNIDGSLARPPIDRRENDGKKKAPTLMLAPQPSKRTSGLAPNFLWDKTSYALGVTAGEGHRTAEEHAAFVTRHEATLKSQDDEGLQALLRFLERWRPGDFARLRWPEEMKDQNIAFSLERDRLSNVRIHDRPAARALWAQLCSQGDKNEAACLITGERGPIARLHPPIKGVWGAQSSGASIVSFNLEASTSYGHEQGDNAAVSEAAAFAYTTMLNRFLERGSGHRAQVGEVSTVFWADATDFVAAAMAEGIFGGFMNGTEPAEQARETQSVGTQRIATIIEAIRQGKPLPNWRLELPQDVRFYVLGLSPNAARLWVRFFIEDDFGKIAENLAAHIRRLCIDPAPREESPSFWRLLMETGAQRKSENIPPQLAGDLLRAILTGSPYPLTLLSAVLRQLRADHDVNALRVSLIKATLIRNFDMNKEAPVALDANNDNPGYLLGRLFATYEFAQTQALRGSTNTTIRDQYYGVASATPQAIFPLLRRKAMHHLSKLKKTRPGLAVNLDRTIGEIYGLVAPEALFMPTLSMQRQALFAIGYYHQRNDFYRSRDDGRDKTTSETKE